MSIFAMINNGTVANTVLADGISDLPEAPEGEKWIQIDTITPRPAIGWATPDGGKTFSAPAAPTPPTPTLTQQAAAALAAGLAVTSASTPAINGTYALDANSQARIIAIETFILKNNAFPGTTGAQLAYPDITGAAHVFPNVTVWSEFATAVANCVADLDLYGAGAAGVTLPAMAATIA